MGEKKLQRLISFFFIIIIIIIFYFLLTEIFNETFDRKPILYLMLNQTRMNGLHYTVYDESGNSINFRSI